MKRECMNTMIGMQCVNISVHQLQVFYPHNEDNNALVAQVIAIGQFNEFNDNRQWNISVYY